MTNSNNLQTIRKKLVDAVVEVSSWNEAMITLAHKPRDGRDTEIVDMIDHAHAIHDYAEQLLTLLRGYQIQKDILRAEKEQATQAMVRGLNA